MRVWPGDPYPLGATWDGLGTNFALFSENADAVELCLFDDPLDVKESERLELRERTDLIWHPDEDLSFDDRDDAGSMPKCVVIDPSFTWEDDAPPRTAWNRTVIYECHVRGMTMLHPGVPDHLRGTFLGLVQDPVLDYLLSLGVTAVELMPVHQFVTERRLVEAGLTNYWGYNSVAYFAPHAGYGSRGQAHVYEFKSMVKAFHRAGIEVFLDVVYNHTGEGNHLGPTLSHRGVDNAAYYRLNPNDSRYYMDFTGTGNSLNMLHPRTMQMITDS